MKMKALLLLCLMPIPIISSDSDRQCLHWFPEPVSYRMPEAYSQLTREFEIIDDFISDRDLNESNRIVEEYVIRTLNSGEAGGYGDMISIVFKQLPTVRQLLIAVSCIIVSVVLFLAVWSLGLADVFDLIGILLRFDRYRSGLTVIPIFCCLGLLILTSNLRTSSGNIAHGISELELKQDERFMPIEDRVAQKLAMVPCLFERDFKKNKEKWRVADRYLNITVNRAQLDEVARKMNDAELIWRLIDNRYQRRRGILFLNDLFFIRGVMGRTWCPTLADNLSSISRKLPSELVFTELQSEVENLEVEYVKIILESLKNSIPVTRKAIGSIGEFVQTYHEHVLQIPRVSIIDFYEKFMESAVGVTVLMACTLTVLMVLKFEFRKKWSKLLAESSVPVTLAFTIISLFLFAVLMTRITFTVLIQQQVLKNSFGTFKKANPVIISENGSNRSINYGELLDVDSTPTSIEGIRLFKSTKKFNDTVAKLTKIMNSQYENYVDTSCAKMEEAVRKMEKNIKKIGSCTEKEFLTNASESFFSARAHICTYSAFLKKTPLNQTWIQETAYQHWVQVLVPLKGLPIIRNSSVDLVRSPMQTYLVFENPSKKLRPTVLENMLDMAVRIGAMAPLFFVMSIYFMCILPMLMGDEQSSGGNQKTFIEKSGSTSKSKSSSLEPTGSKSKSLSNEK